MIRCEGSRTAVGTFVKGVGQEGMTPPLKIFGTIATQAACGRCRIMQRHVQNGGDIGRSPGLSASMCKYFGAAVTCSCTAWSNAVFL